MAPQTSSRPTDKRERNDFQRRLESHFLACSAVAGTAAFLAAPSAEATIVYSGTKDIPVPLNSVGLSIDLDTGAFSTTEEIAGFDLKFYGSQGHGDARLNFTTGSPTGNGAEGIITVHKGSSSSSSSSYTTAAVKKLNAAKLISGKKTFATTGSLGTVSSSSSSSSSERTGSWGHGGTGYVGFRFVSAEHTTLYGWVQLAVASNLSTTVVDWAYEDSGEPIIAGQTQSSIVSLKVPVADGTEGGSAAVFKFTRKGDLTENLNVQYEVDNSSTAVSGIDYQPIYGTILLPAGEKKASLSIYPIDNSTRDGERTLILNLLPGAGYVAGSVTQGTVFIEDND